MWTVCLITSSVLAATASAFKYASCLKGLDVVQVQDMTSSFDPLWDAMADQVPEVLTRIQESHPNAYFGFATFGDKPISPLGFSTDYSLRVDISLDVPHVQETEDLFHNYYNNAAGGGADWPEGVVEALFRAMMAPALGWRAPSDRNLEERYGRMVVIVTDAMSHDPGDVDLLAHQTLPPFDVTVADMMEHGENYKSAEVEYPDIVNVAAFAELHDFNIVFICAPAGIVYPDGSFTPYGPLARKGERYRKIDGLSLWFQDEFEAAGIHNVHVIMVDQHMEGYAAAFDHALDDFFDTECGSTTTSTTSTPYVDPTWTGPSTTSPTTHGDTPPTTTVRSSSSSTYSITSGPGPSRTTTSTSSPHSPSSSVDVTLPECTEEPTLPECTEEPTLPECTEEPTLPECVEQERNSGSKKRSQNIDIKVNVSTL